VVERREKFEVENHDAVADEAFYIYSFSNKPWELVQPRQSSANV
jgi:hypothetical protein